MQYHYTLVFDTKTNRWSVEDGTITDPDRPVYDPESMEWLRGGDEIDDAASKSVDLVVKMLNKLAEWPKQ